MRCSNTEETAESRLRAIILDFEPDLLYQTIRDGEPQSEIPNRQGAINAKEKSLIGEERAKVLKAPGRVVADFGCRIETWDAWRPWRHGGSRFISVQGLECASEERRCQEEHHGRKHEQI